MADTDIYILFNYFERIPSNYLEGMKHICGWLSKYSESVEGLLLQNVDPNDKWLYMNYAMISSKDHIMFQPKPELEPEGKPPGPPAGGTPSSGAIFGAQLKEGFKEGIKDIVAHPGGFSEVATQSALDSSIPKMPKKPANLETTGFMMVPFPNSGDCNFTEENWPEEAGANFVRDNVPLDLALRRITFHKRFTKDGDFSHVLLCEFSEALSHIDIAKEFVGKYRELKKGDSPALMKVAMPYWSAA